MGREAVSAEIIVKIENIDGERVVNIPEQFGFDCDQAILRYDGRKIVLEPLPNRGDTKDPPHV